MYEEIGESTKNTQIFMIVWNLKLKFNQKVNKIDICTPNFSLNATNIEDKVNWIHLERFDDKFKIDSNFSSFQFKRCTTYLINPLTNTVFAEYKDFDTFSWKHYDRSWSEEMQIVFEVMMQSTAIDPPIIWQHFDTETLSQSNTNDILLNISETDLTSYTVLSDQSRSCVVKRISKENNHHTFGIFPEKVSQNWNLLTLMLQKLENNVWEWQYQQTTSSRMCGRYFPNTNPVVIVKIMEIHTSFENVRPSGLQQYSNGEA